MLVNDVVREHIPLEQGLRPFSLSDLPSSVFSQRAYSIRTRIKTAYRSIYLQAEMHVREHVPLEQGLRH